MRTIIFILTVILFIGCEKEDKTVTTSKGIPAVADAGGDFSVTIPDEYPVLTGTEVSRSPTSYRAFLWQNLSKTPLLSFSQSESSGKAYPVFLSAGNYQFQLRARNSFGEDFDTVSVEVKFAPRCNAEREMIAGGSFISIGPALDSIPFYPAMTTSNGKLIFAGGYFIGSYWDESYSSRLVIFEPVAKKYTSYTLTVPRADITAAVSGDHILLAGGNEETKISDLVEVFDQVSGKINVQKLSVARYAMTSAVVGNLIFFAGGFLSGNGVSDVVDIYDINTDSWAVTRLSQARSNISTVVAGNKIFFGGGMTALGGLSNVVDVYDVDSRSWSVLKLSEARSAMQGVFFDGKVVFTGGMTDLDGTSGKSIDIIDPRNMTVTTDCLLLGHFSPTFSQGAVSTSALVMGDRLYINDGGHLAYLDKLTNKWKYSIGPNSNYAMFKVGNDIYAFSYQYGGNKPGKYEIFRYED